MRISANICVPQLARIPRENKTMRAQSFEMYRLISGDVFGRRAESRGRQGARGRAAGGQGGVGKQRAGRRGGRGAGFQGGRMAMGGGQDGKGGKSGFGMNG